VPYKTGLTVYILNFRIRDSVFHLLEYISFLNIKYDIALKQKCYMIPHGWVNGQSFVGKIFDYCASLATIVWLI
jgi:hypothetical protein